MRALKIATKPERPEIRARCQSLLDEAERIKQMPEWVKTKRESDLADSFANIDLQSGSSKGSDLRTETSFTPFLAPSPSKKLPSDGAALAPVSTSLNLQSQVPAPDLVLQRPKLKPTIRLREPVSSRVLPVAEKVLLLHASKLNGYKFPPWSGPPKLDEFHLEDGQEPFK